VSYFSTLELKSVLRVTDTLNTEYTSRKNACTLGAHNTFSNEALDAFYGAIYFPTAAAVIVSDVSSLFHFILANARRAKSANFYRACCERASLIA